MRSRFLVFLAGGLVWANAHGVTLGQGANGDCSQGAQGTGAGLLDYVGGLVPANYGWPIAVAFGQDDRALAYLTEIIRRAPNDSTAYLVRAWVFGKKKDFDRALADCTTALRLDPDHAGAHALRGVAYGYKGDFDRAIADLTEALRHDPTDRSSLQFRGLFYLFKRAFDESIRDYTTVLQLDPNAAAVYAMRACVYVAKEDFDEAIKDFKAAHDLEPSNLNFLTNLAGVYLIRDRHQKAVKTFTAVIQLAPQYGHAFSGRAMAKAALGDYAGALVDLWEALRLNPNDAEANRDLARLLATCPEDGLRDGKRAVQLGRRACELTDWQEANSISSLAAAFAEIGNFNEAVKLEKKALELAPAKCRDHYRSQLDLYQAGKPFRASRPPGSGQN